MSTDEQKPKTNHSGRWTVVGMFLFALMMIGMLFLYWELYTAPFRDLQYAIAESFPDSSPRVVGGQHKSHKEGTPKILRVVIYVPDKEFDPEVDLEKSDLLAFEIVRMAFEHQNVDEYDQVDIVLLQKVPESGRKRWSVSKPVQEWRVLLAAEEK